MVAEEAERGTRTSESDLLSGGCGVCSQIFFDEKKEAQEA